MNILDKRRKEQSLLPGQVQLHSAGSRPDVELHGNDAVSQAQQMVQDQSPVAADYQSPWQDQLNGILRQIMGRKPFEYNMNADELYQQYKDQYARQGSLAMQDTMGQAAKLTGGYGNSFAQTAGQQVFQGYQQQLNDRIPELYNLALSKYQMEGQNLMDQFSMLGAMDDRDYGRFQDDRSWEYQQGRDQISDSRYDQEWDYQQERDRIEDEWRQKEFDEAKRQYDQQYALQQEKSSSSSSSNPGSTRNPGNGVKADNGSLTPEQVKALQKALGVDQDGRYGPKSKAAAGGLSAEEAYKKFVEGAGDGTLSSAGQAFMNNLPYPHAGSDINVWKNTVRTRLEKQYNEGKLSEDDVVIILKKLGIA